MPVISYTASRELVGSAGAQQIEADFEAFPRKQVFRGSFDETLDGTPEGWLDAIVRQYTIQSDLVLTANVARWREFFASVAARETFQIDLTGTIASPGTDLDVFLLDRDIDEQQIAAVGTRYTFRVQVIP